MMVGRDGEEGRQRTFSLLTRCCRRRRWGCRRGRCSSWGGLWIGGLGGRLSGSARRGDCICHGLSIRRNLFTHLRGSSRLRRLTRHRRATCHRCSPPRRRPGDASCELAARRAGFASRCSALQLGHIPLLVPSSTPASLSFSFRRVMAVSMSLISASLSSSASSLISIASVGPWLNVLPMRSPCPSCLWGLRLLAQPVQPFMESPSVCMNEVIVPRRGKALARYSNWGRLASGRRVVTASRVKSWPAHFGKSLQPAPSCSLPPRGQWCVSNCYFVRARPVRVSPPCCERLTLATHCRAPPLARSPRAVVASGAAMLFAAHVGATPSAAEAQGLMPPGSERALSRWPFMNARKLAFNQTACDALREGTSVEDVDKEYHHSVATSDREIVFNLGSYKTGSSSLNEALESLGFHACKTAWNDLGGQFASFDMVSIAAFKASPTSGDSPLHKAINRCTALGDAPWLFLFPTLMRAFPKAKFILTRQPSCEDWVYHVRGLWQWAGSARSKVDDSVWQKVRHRRRAQCLLVRSWAPDATKLWHSRCVETERAIVKTARKLDRPLLVLPATWTDQEKWAALDQFLGTNSTRPARLPVPPHGRAAWAERGATNAPADENAHSGRRSRGCPTRRAGTNSPPRRSTAVSSEAGLLVRHRPLVLRARHDSASVRQAPPEPGQPWLCQVHLEGGECTAEAFVEGLALPRGDRRRRVPLGELFAPRREARDAPLALGTQPNGGFSVPTKDIWDMYQCPDGAQSLKEHQSWLMRLGARPSSTATCRASTASPSPT